MVRDYELMYIVRPDLDDDALRVATESVDTLIAGLGGTVAKTTLWGKRRLAYEVDRLRDGHYVITLLQLDGERITDLERALTIHDTVFRHLLVRRDETAPGLEIEGIEAPAAEDAGPVRESAAKIKPVEEEETAAEEEEAEPVEEEETAAEEEETAAEEKDIPEAEIAAEDEE